MATVGLSEFQEEKLKYYFKFFDTEGRDAIGLDNLDGFMERVLKYTGWDKNGNLANECYEIHHTFFEVLQEKADHDSEDKVHLDHWISLWEHLLPGCMGRHNFPVWLRLLPRSLFRIIDRKEDGFLDVEELESFYTELIGMTPKESQKVSVDGYNQMTDNGRHPLNMESYDQIFANFLLGRTPYGPGRFIFGCLHEVVNNFKLISITPTTHNIDEEGERYRLAAMRRSSSSHKVRLVLRT